MHELIAPAARWLLRLSLFLAVVGWAVSRGWSVEARFSPVLVLLNSDGWVTAAPSGMDAALVVGPANRSLQNPYFFRARNESQPSFSVRGFSVAGFTINVLTGGGIRNHAIIGLRHWTFFGVSLIGLAIAEVVSHRRRRRLQHSAPNTPNAES